MYTGAEIAYGSLDFNGKGFITQQVLLDSHVVQNKLLPRFSIQQIRNYFSSSGLFPDEKTTINFDTFKKSFFPHLYIGNEDKDDDDDIKAADLRFDLDNKLEQQP